MGRGSHGSGSRKTLCPSSWRCPHGRRPQFIRRGQVRANARRSQSVCLRWKRNADARLRESWADDPSFSGACGRLPDFTRRPDIHLREARYDASADSERTFTGRYICAWRTAACTRLAGHPCLHRSGSCLSFGLHPSRLAGTSVAEGASYSSSISDQGIDSVSLAIAFPLNCKLRQLADAM